ncbi:bacterio-opsin activator [Paenibacillus antri]|uniref:Bacterio-opsin activator n=1 Tax=Paenibacillus antri TaxID=2582848 RepID=A0A5R9GKL7_9BACL|nr:bacterio-opsin activator [Paenibacillus antri]TLS54058.1 bacterio-opsin activator [Paenibacillus antri]
MNRVPVIGFVEEIARFEEWMTDPAAETTVFSISGIGGIGKTTLLMEMARGAGRASAMTLWLDGSGETSTSGAFLTGLETTLESEYGRTRPADMPLLTFVVAELSRQRTVLLLDNGERIDRLEGWLLSSFLPKLASAQVLLAAASRNGLPLTWRTNPHWGPRVRSFPLQPFTRREVQAYLRHSGLAADVQEEIARKSEGHPLLLALTVEWMRSNGEAAPRGIPSIVTAELLREATSPSLHRVLTAMSLLPPSDPQTLNRMLDAPLDVADVHALGRLSFVLGTPQGWALHPLVARLLREDYAAAFPEAFRRLRRKAFALLEERFPEADKKSQMRIAGHVLELYREFLPSTNAYAVFTSNVDIGERRPFEPADLPELQRLLAASVEENNWQSELALAGQYAALLEEIAAHSPEGICVVRNAEGRPIAFSAGILLHARTMPLLERYTPEFPVLLGEEAESLRQLPPEAADTMLVALAAVDSSRSVYQPEEIGGVLMLEWFIMMTGGWRGRMVSADPQLNGLLSVFGFHDLGQVGGMTKWEIDFRHVRFDAWMKTVIRHTGADGGNGEERPAGGTGERMRLAEQDAKLILQRLYDEGDALDPYVGDGGRYRTKDELRGKVLALLTEERPTHPLSPLDQRILRESYLTKARNKNQLADDFHMSRTTFYRHSQSALRRLAQALNG